MLRFALMVFILYGAQAFVIQSSPTRVSPLLEMAVSKESRQSLSSKSEDTTTTTTTSVAPSRRLVLGGLLSGALVLGGSRSSNAIPLVTTKEFETILRESGRSVQVVEFSGVKNEIVTARLVDGTAFGVADVVESSTDPRSPLALAAICREYNVPTKFLSLEAILSKTSTNKKKKNYANSAVREAAEKEKIKQERMRQEEAARLKALYEMEAAEAAKQLAEEEEAKKIDN